MKTPNKDQSFKINTPRSFFSDVDNPNDPKKRQGNYVEDFNTLPEQEKTTPVQQVQPTTEDRLQRLFELRAPKPTYDPNRPEELRRLARNATIAKGLSLIGDNIALAKGANVSRAPQDNSEKVYNAEMRNYMNNYQQRLDDWNWRDFTNRLRLGQMVINQDNWQRSFDERQENADRSFNFGVAKDERDFKAKKEKFDKEMDFKEKNLNQSKEYHDVTAAERERHNRQMELAAKLHAQKTGNKTIKVQTNDGKTHTFSPEEASFIRNDALKNIDRLIKAYPHMFTTKETNEIDTKTGNFKKEYLLSRNTTDQDLIRAFLQLPKEQEEKGWKIPEIWGGPRNTAQPKPSPTKSTIDYSKLNY